MRRQGILQANELPDYWQPTTPGLIIFVTAIVFLGMH